MWKANLERNSKYEVVNKLLMLFFVLAVNILNQPTAYVSAPAQCFILGCIEKLVVVINWNFWLRRGENKNVPVCTTGHFLCITQWRRRVRARQTIGLCHQRRVGQFKLITLFLLGNQGYIAACDLTRHHLADRPSMVTLLDTGSKQCFPHR